MREIRFRVWDQTHGRFERVDDVYYIDKYGEFETLSFADERGLRPILMQYIGLKDKHGKDIYEGDIVRINHPHDLTGDFTGATGEVFWWDEEGGWYHTNNHGRPPKRMWQYLEVIGNIYEHPHLLTPQEQEL